MNYRYKKIQLIFLMENQQEHKKITQYALKGQKLLAQGIALGIIAISKTPCKGNSFKFCPEF